MPSTIAAEEETLRLDTGVVSGVRGIDASVRVFKGLPFAAPPVGALRWRPPQPVRPWVGIRKADQFSPICPQPPRVGVAALLGTSQRLGASNEDCLYLNVWTTATSSNEKRPVMVWFPGGGFTTGGGSALRAARLVYHAVPRWQRRTHAKPQCDTQAWRVEHWMRMQALAGIPNTYLYYFTRRAPIDAPGPNRAYHGAEAFYVFHNLHLFAQKWTDVDRALEDVVSTYRVNFATRGDPNGPNLPRWAAYMADRRDSVMMLGDTVEETSSRLDRSKFELFDAYYARLLSH